MVLIAPWLYEGDPYWISDEPTGHCDVTTGSYGGRSSSRNLSTGFGKSSMLSSKSLSASLRFGNSSAWKSASFAEKSKSFINSRSGLLQSNSTSELHGSQSDNLSVSKSFSQKSFLKSVSSSLKKASNFFKSKSSIKNLSDDQLSGSIGKLGSSEEVGSSMKLGSSRNLSQSKRNNQSVNFRTSRDLSDSILSSKNFLDSSKSMTYDEMEGR